MVDPRYQVILEFNPEETLSTDRLSHYILILLFSVVPISSIPAINVIFNQELKSQPNYNNQ